MSEQTSGKKVVSRNTAIALGIICILLAVGIVGTVVSYQSRALFSNVFIDFFIRLSNIKQGFYYISSYENLRNQTNNRAFGTDGKYFITPQDSTVKNLVIQFTGGWLASYYLSACFVFRRFILLL